MPQTESDFTRSVSGFRIRILARVMFVILALSLAGVFIAQRHLSRLADKELQQSVEQRVRLAEITRTIRQTTLSDICDSLSRKPRIRAALEDNAIDLLYPSANDELRRIMRPRIGSSGGDRLHAIFYRFIGADGALIEPAASDDAGTPGKDFAKVARFDGAPERESIGYSTIANADGSETLVELFVSPIISSEFFDPIAAIVVGFPLEDAPSDNLDTHSTRFAYWINGRLVGLGIDGPVKQRFENHLANRAESLWQSDEMQSVELGNETFRYCSRPMNSGSSLPTAYQVFLASLDPLEREQAAATRQILGVAAGLMLVGLALGTVVARKLARPVENLAKASEAEREHRIHAEHELDRTSKELERAARFSADASHQLKTPVTVLRAGLETLLEEPDLPQALRLEIHGMIRQTGRLSAVIDDLLLLSRLDSGRLELELKPHNLKLMVEELLDDISILPNPMALEITTQIPDDLYVSADRRYAVLILQNLLENARKYNRAGGRIVISAHAAGASAIFRIGNNGVGISPQAATHIFDRFHRGHVGENVPGYGLGLNLSRELAALHRGKLSLAKADDDWTEFELSLPLAPIG